MKRYSRSTFVVFFTVYFHYCANLLSPTSLSTKCGRYPETGIRDPDERISPSGSETTEYLLDIIASAAYGNLSLLCGTEAGGFHMAIALLNSARSLNNTELYAKELYESWIVRVSSCDNGILLLFSLADRHIDIFMGATVKHHLSEGSVLPNRRPTESVLSEDSIDNAVLLAIISAYRTVSGGKSFIKATPLPPLHPLKWKRTFDAIFVVLFILMFAPLFWTDTTTNDQARLHERTLRCQAALTKLEDDHHTAQQSLICSQVSCPICLEDFQNEITPHIMVGEATSSAPLEPVFESSVGLEKTATSSCASVARLKSLCCAGQGQRVKIFHQSLQCGHSYHMECLRSMLNNLSSNDRCPVCRRIMFDAEDPGRFDKPSLAISPAEEQQSALSSSPDANLPGESFDGAEYSPDESLPFLALGDGSGNRAVSENGQFRRLLGKLIYGIHVPYGHPF